MLTVAAVAAFIFIAFFPTAHSNYEEMTSINVGYNFTLVVWCTGAYMVKTTESGVNGTTRSCGLDSDGNLLLVFYETNNDSSGNYTCRQSDASTTIHVNVSEVHYHRSRYSDDDPTTMFNASIIESRNAYLLALQQQSTNNSNEWLSFSNGGCSSKKWKILRSDELWIKNNNEVVCSRKAVIENCNKSEWNAYYDQKDQDDGLERYLAPIITVSMLLFIVVIVIIGFTFMRRKHSEIDDLLKLHNELIESSAGDTLVRSDKPLREQLDNLPFDRSYEIRLQRIAIRKVKSKGRYGRVYLAELRSKTEGTEAMEVNVKGPKEAAKYDDVRALADEAKVMMAIGIHPNVLGLIGVVIENMPRGGDLYVVVEYTHNNLKTFLHKRKEYFIDELLSKETEQNNLKGIKSKREKMQKTLGPSITTTVLCSFAYQIANGMEFLAKKNCVHRDLAARNVLLRENRTIRIADFGEDRQWDYHYLMQEIEYASPFKIMARESISESRFTEKSDVWSYGVLLWEIFTLGDDPHENIHSPQKLAEYYQNGGRLRKPVYMPDNVSSLMFDCWQEDPTKRPTFLNCKNITQNILKERNIQFFCWLQNQLHEEYIQMKKYAEWRDGPCLEDTGTDTV